jgi:hypothetical protein
LQETKRVYTGNHQETKSGICRGGDLTRIRITDDRLRVYRKLREGISQSEIVNKTDLKKSMVFKTARYLVKEGFLTDLSKGTPHTYGPGDRADELDELVEETDVKDSTDDEVSSDAIGVTQVSSTVHDVATILAHHHRVKFKVEKVGDCELLKVPKKDGSLGQISFLDSRSYQENYRGVTRTKGKLRFGGIVLSVELEKTAGGETFYIYGPRKDFTRQQLIDDPEIYDKWVVAQCQEAANFVSKWGGWRFGLPELCDWIPHYAGDDKRLFGLLNTKFTAGDGEVWTSNSEGRAELETSNPRLAPFVKQIPEQLKNLTEGVGQLKEDRVLDREILLEIKLQMRDIIEIWKMQVEAEKLQAEAATIRQEREVAANGSGGPR